MSLWLSQNHEKTGGAGPEAREIPLDHIPDIPPNAQWQLWQDFLIQRVEGRGRG